MVLLEDVPPSFKALRRPVVYAARFFLKIEVILNSTIQPLTPIAFSLSPGRHL